MANFVDHFPGSSLDSRWSEVTAGAGSISVSDSKVAITGGAAAADAAFIHTASKIDKSKSQLWVFAVNNPGAGNYRLLQLVDKSTAPVPDTIANFDPIIRMRVDLGNAPGLSMTVSRHDSSHVRTGWDTAASAWQSGTQPFITPFVRDDYVVIGFEIDGPGAQWRILGWHKPSSGGYTYDQGLRLFAISDWTAWSFMESTDDLWLMCGWPFTNVAITGDMEIEWVRFADKPPTGFATAAGRIHAWVNGQTSLGAGYNIKHWWSYDGEFFVPQDRTTVAVPSGGASAWDEVDAKDKSVIRDGSTYYMAYSGKNASNVQQIGLATTTDPDGSWTKDGGNPIITRTSGQHDDQIFAPKLIKDYLDPDSDKRFKILYGGFSAIDGKGRIFLATASVPDGTWTKQGAVLEPGTTGQWDDLMVSNAFAFRQGGGWEVWYAGVKSGVSTPNWQVGRATTSDLNTAGYAKDGSNPYITRDADAVQVISADLSGGRIASMASTTGFVQDGFIHIDDDATQNDYGQSRIRKVNAGVSLELYYSLNGWTAAANSQIRQVDAFSAITIHHIVNAGGKWFFYVTPFAAYAEHGSFLAYTENTGLLTSATLLGAKSWEHLATPVITKTDWGHLRSSENMALVSMPMGGLDTENKRRSAFSPLPVLTLPPVPDGVID